MPRVQSGVFPSGFVTKIWEVVGLERGPLSLVSTIEELLGRNSSSTGLENREYGRGGPLRWPRNTLYPQKLTLTLPICGGRSVGIVRLRTKTTEFVLYMYYMSRPSPPPIFDYFNICRKHKILNSSFCNCARPSVSSFHISNILPRILTWNTFPFRCLINIFFNGSSSTFRALASYSAP
jgi:hypothetical protein